MGRLLDTANRSKVANSDAPDNQDLVIKDSLNLFLTYVYSGSSFLKYTLNESGV